MRRKPIRPSARAAFQSRSGHRRPLTRPLPAPLLRLRSDEQLLALFRAGREDAFRAIHDRYHDRLLAYVRHMLRGSSEAEDVVQDVFLRAYGALRSGERDIAVRPWLYRVAHNRCIDYVRRAPAPPLQPDELLPGGTDPAAEAERREDLRRLVADLHNLPEQQRSALIIRELEGLSYAELGDRARRHRAGRQVAARARPQRARRRGRGARHRLRRRSARSSRWPSTAPAARRGCCATTCACARAAAPTARRSATATSSSPACCPPARRRCCSAAGSPPCSAPAAARRPPPAAPRSSPAPPRRSRSPRPRWPWPAAPSRSSTASTTSPRPAPSSAPPRRSFPSRRPSAAPTGPGGPPGRRPADAEPQAGPRDRHRSRPVVPPVDEAEDEETPTPDAHADRDPRADRHADADAHPRGDRRPPSRPPSRPPPPRRRNGGHADARALSSRSVAAREHDYDWIVIGSGFGGSVSALRLAEKGYRVARARGGPPLPRRGLRQDDLERPPLLLAAAARPARASSA